MMKNNLDTLATKEHIEKLKDHFYRSNEVDLAQEFSDLSNAEKILWIRLMDKDLLADTFSLLTASEKEHVVTLLSDKEVIELIAELESDELVDTIQEMPANIVKRLIGHIEKNRRQQINFLLNYPEGSAGSVMTIDYLSMKVDHTVEEVRQALINSDLEADNLEEIWIIDNTRKLVGYVSLADLFRTKLEKIRQIMIPVSVKVFATDDQEKAARLAQQYFLSAIPVVDSENRLIGSIQAEELLTILQAEYNEDMSNLQGIRETIDSNFYLRTNPLKIARNRVTWLIICLITATITGFIIQKYESLLATSVALVAFIPMLMDSGGNAGSQSSTTLIRALSTGDVQIRDWLKVLGREALIGVYVGIILAIVNSLRIFIFDSQPISIIITVSITLCITIVISKVVGAALPLIAIKLKIDPTIMAGPIITTIVDTLALVIFFEVAKILLNLAH